MGVNLTEPRFPNESWWSKRSWKGQHTQPQLSFKYFSGCAGLSMLLCFDSTGRAALSLLTWSLNAAHRIRPITSPWSVVRFSKCF